MATYFLTHERRGGYREASTTTTQTFDSLQALRDELDACGVPRRAWDRGVDHFGKSSYTWGEAKPVAAPAAVLEQVRSAVAASLAETGLDPELFGTYPTQGMIDEPDWFTSGACSGCHCEYTSSESMEAARATHDLIEDHRFTEDT